MSDVSRWAQLASTYTPGTVSDRPTQNGSTGYPPSPATGQVPMASMAPRVPIVAVLIVLALLFLLERRRIRLGRKL